MTESRNLADLGKLAHSSILYLIAFRQKRLKNICTYIYTYNAFSMKLTKLPITPMPNPNRKKKNNDKRQRRQTKKLNTMTNRSIIN